MSNLPRSGSANPPAFAPALADILHRVSYRRVRLEDQMDPVYRLRYEAYRREEFIPVNSQMTLVDVFDPAPNAYCYGIYIDDELVSSVRFHHVTQQTRVSPSQTVWPEILDPIIDSGITYIDPTRFTADYEASLAFPALPFLTMRLVTMACEYFGVKYCLHSVRPEHGAFYRRMFQSTVRGEPRTYPGLFFPMVLYLSDIPEVRATVQRRFPVFMSTEEERHQLYGLEGEKTYSARIIPSALSAYKAAHSPTETA